MRPSWVHTSTRIAASGKCSCGQQGSYPEEAANGENKQAYNKYNPNLVEFSQAVLGSNPKMAEPKPNLVGPNPRLVAHNLGLVEPERNSVEPKQMSAVPHLHCSDLWS